MNHNLIDNMNRLLDKPGGKQAIRFIINSLSGIPIAGGAISASASLWGEIEQQNFNNVIAEWANQTEIEKQEISRKLENLLQTPTKAKFALLIGEIMGNELAEKFLSGIDHQIPMILNNNTLNELQPFIEKKWLTISSTGNSCSMGSGNRIGNHIEELKRPWGIGNGFILKLNYDYFL